MPYDGKILSRAMARFDEDKQRRARQFRERQQQLFAREPELADIDRRLRGTMSQIIAKALKGGQDPVPAIHAIRDENLALQRRREELLTAMGYPADYLEEKPRCARCGDAGFLPDGSMCACLRSYYAREQIAELSHMLDIGSQSFDTFRLDYYSTDRGGLPRSPREAAQRNLEICQSFARDFRPGKQNLLLFGAPGLGKTFLSACIARVVSEDGFSVVYDTAGHIFSQFEAAKFRRDDVDEPDESVERCMACDLLILDDLGTEMTTAFVQSALYQLLNGRLLAGKSTIISTNLDPDQIGRRYSAQIMSRLEGEFELLPFIGQAGAIIAAGHMGPALHGFDRQTLCRGRRPRRPAFTKPEMTISSHPPILRGSRCAGFLSSPQNELTTANVTTLTAARCIIFQKSAPSSCEHQQIISTE